MNDNYLYDYVSSLERVLSSGYAYKCSTKALEKFISYSYYFQRVERDRKFFSPTIDDTSLVNSLFTDIHVDLKTVPEYSQCLWAAESYLRIQFETRLTFEAIFLYFPLEKMYECFNLYHEMDFTQIIDLFKSFYKNKSILSILLKKYGKSLKEIANTTNIPYATLYSLKQRKRDIKKTSVENALALADFFQVRLETLIEMEI